MLPYNMSCILIYFLVEIKFLILITVFFNKDKLINAASTFSLLLQVTPGISLRKHVCNYHTYCTQTNEGIFNKCNLARHSGDNKLNIGQLTFTINRLDCSLYCICLFISHHGEQNKSDDRSVYLCHTRQMFCQPRTRKGFRWTVNNISHIYH